jgi:hypothetical protein
MRLGVCERGGTARSVPRSDIGGYLKNLSGRNKERNVAATVKTVEEGVAHEQ